MSGTTSVPAPTFGDAGFQVPTERAILDGVLADMSAAFGGNLNEDLSTPQGQLASSLAAIIGDCFSQFLFYTNQVDPAYASGRMQDAIARIYFLTRKPALATTVQATCTGLPGVQIPTGAMVQATDGNLYTCSSGGTIAASGSISLPFVGTKTGPISCPATTLNAIYRTGYLVKEGTGVQLCGQHDGNHSGHKRRLFATISVLCGLVPNGGRTAVRHIG
jgi:hypothetical protein